MPAISVRYKITQDDLEHECWEEYKMAPSFNDCARWASEEIPEAKDIKEAYKIFKQCPDCSLKSVVRRKFDRVDFEAVSKLVKHDIVDLWEGRYEFITESDHQFIKYYDSDGRIYRILVRWEKISPLEGRFIFEYEPRMYE